MDIKPKSPRHPHAYTLQLLRLAIEKAPPLFDRERLDFFARRLEEYERDKDTPYEQIRLAITQLGRETWPYRQAYAEMYDRYGRSSEESFLHENLDEGVRGKYERFIHEGGKLNYLERPRSAEGLTAPTPFESYFSPEEKFALTQALLVARDYSRAEINDLVTGSKRDEYEMLVDDYRAREKGIAGRIDELRSFAELSPKWKQAISDRVRVIEDGWSVMEQMLDEEQLDREIDYWRGTLQTFLQA